MSRIKYNIPNKQITVLKRACKRMHLSITAMAVRPTLAKELIRTQLAYEQKWSTKS